MRRTRPQPSARLGRRGTPQLRLRAGFVVIAVVLSFFAARLVQLQGFDPHAYAARAAAADLVQVVLPATRGDIVDRNGQPMADSVAGEMVVADPSLTRKKAPAIARLLVRKLGVDYFSTLAKLEDPHSRFAYIDRHVPSTIADAALSAAAADKYPGLYTRTDPVRDYPGGDVAANLVGFMGTDGPLGGLELSFDHELAGTDGSASYEVGDGNRIPLGASTTVPAHNGETLHTTIDSDLQWYAQRVLRQTVEEARGDSGVVVVMDSRTGEVLTLADDPTFDASDPSAAASKADLGSRALSDVYEPGSVEKVLTFSSLIDAGKVTDRTKEVVPPELDRDGTVIHDYFPHGTLHLTTAGVLAKSSNIGTVLATDSLSPARLRSYLTSFGLGKPTGIGLAGESDGVIPAGSALTSETKDRMAFGQGMSVNALQMTAAVNAVANGGVRIDPSLIEGHATTDDGQTVGTDEATSHRVVSENAAHQTMLMMERVIVPGLGVAPEAAVPGYRVAGKTGTAQRAVDGRYDGTYTVSFAGFAPADKPRFTVYVMVQNPRNGGGGGSVAGPAFSKIMGYALRRYDVPPTGTKPSTLPVTW